MIAKYRGSPDEVKVMSVIRVIALRGSGTDKDVYRQVTQYWGFDGVLLAEKDEAGGAG